VAGSHALRPVVSPLFDGVVVAEPYRYLDPPPGEAGSPLSAESTVPVDGASSPAFAVYTAETPPQAELLAHGGELAVDARTGSLRVTIRPIPAPAGATGDNVAGNVYEFGVTDRAGAPVSMVIGQSITLALRSPAGTSADATIARWQGGAWRSIPTEPSGLQDLFITSVDSLGAYAVIGTLATPPTDSSPVALIAAIAVAGLILFFAQWFRAGPDQRRGGAPGARRRGQSTRRRTHP
jgi:hypothetical protein